VAANEKHGVGCTLRNNGNDGWATIDEDAEGNVVVKVMGQVKTLAIVTSQNEEV
jgi:hypothetical protein